MSHPTLETPAGAVVAPRLVILPSVDGGGFALFALPPPGLSAQQIKDAVEAIVTAANTEDAINDSGGCNDGLCVQDSIERRLSAQGFVFPRADVDLVQTIEWDRVPKRRLGPTTK